MKNVIVYSPIEDKQIRVNLNDSPIWKKAYHESDLSVIEKKHPVLWQYTIKFDGTKPIQVTKVIKHTK